MSHIFSANNDATLGISPTHAKASFSRYLLGVEGSRNCLRLIGHPGRLDGRRCRAVACHQPVWIARGATVGSAHRIHTPQISHRKPKRFRRAPPGGQTYAEASDALCNFELSNSGGRKSWVASQFRYFDMNPSYPSVNLDVCVSQLKSPQVMRSPTPVATPSSRVRCSPRQG